MALVNNQGPVTNQAERDVNVGIQHNQYNYDTNGINPDDKLPASVCELPGFILSPYFTGRSDELQQIDRTFGTPSGDLPARCVIHGMPGVGKTQLALKFATLTFHNGQYSYVFWVSAASAEKLSQDVSKMVDLLRLPGRHTQNQASRLTAARAWLEDSTVIKSWLVVLDNVSEETATTTLLDFLPRQSCGGRILMTTRIATIAERYTASGGSPQLALQPPRIDDAVAILSAGAKQKQEGIAEVSRTDAERLVRSVGKLPLAIDQAASYMRESGSSAQEVLDLYESDEVSEILSWENDLSRHKEKSMMAIYTPALNRIQQVVPDAVTLLRVLCFYDPEGISISIFTQGCEALHQEDRDGSLEAQTVDKLKAVEDLFQSRIRLSKAIQEVQRLSLAAYTIEDTERIIRIHDLVHHLLRSKLMIITERRQWLEIAIYVVCKAFEDIGNRLSPQNWSRCGRFISHIESLEGFAEQYGIEDNEILDARIWAALYLDVCGLYEKAATLNERILVQQKSVLGEEHPDTLTSMGNLASTYRNQGRWKEAEELQVGVMKTTKRVLGEEHPHTLTNIGNLALIYWKQGHWKEAEELEVGVMETTKRVLGEEHPDTLSSIGNLASIYWNQGRWKKAEELEMGVMEARKRVLGEEHPDTLTSIGNLALIYQNQGHWKEAEELQVGVMKTRKRVLGEEHPHTLSSIANLALTYRNQGHWKEAEKLQVGVIETRKRVLGEEHPYTLTSIGNLASTYMNQGHWKEAEELQVEVIKTIKRVLGEEHPYTLSSIANLASTYPNQGRWKEAEKLQVGVMEARKRVLGEEHPDTLTSMNNLAFTWKEQSRDTEAFELMKSCVQLRSRILGIDHLHTISSSTALTEWQR